MITPENVQILKRRNPRKLELVKKLLLPYHESIKKIGDPRVSIHEKRKTLQKAQVGAGVIKSIKKLVLPLLKK